MRNVLGIAVALALTACATSNPNVVPVYATQRMSQVYDATVLSVRPVTIDGSQSGVGAGVVPAVRKGQAKNFEARRRARASRGGGDRKRVV